MTVVFVRNLLQVLLGPLQKKMHFTNTQAGSIEEKGCGILPNCTGYKEDNELPERRRCLMAEVPSSQEFSKGVEEEGLTSTQAVVPAARKMQEKVTQPYPWLVKQPDSSFVFASEKLGFSNGERNRRRTAAESPTTEGKIIVSELDTQVLGGNRYECPLIGEVLSSQVFDRRLEEKDGMASTQVLDAGCRSSPKYPTKINGKEDMDDFLEDISLESFEETLANISDEDLETTFMQLSKKHLKATDTGENFSEMSKTSLNEGGQVVWTAGDNIESLLVEPVENNRMNFLTLDGGLVDLEDNDTFSKEKRSSEKSLVLEGEVSMGDDFAVEFDKTIEDDMEDTLAELWSKDMNALEQILFSEELTDPVGEVKRLGAEKSKEMWRKSSSSKRKSEHVFDFDLEDAKTEPARNMEPYKSVKQANHKRQRKGMSDFPTGSLEIPSKNVGKETIQGAVKGSSGKAGSDSESNPEITLQVFPSINIKEEEEEDPDISFNFKGDSEIMLEKTLVTIFKVDPEITFNFKSPQTVIGRDSYSKEENDYSVTRNGKFPIKKRYADEEDAAILAYLDQIIVEKESSDEMNKCSQRIEIDEVFKKMEMDKVLVGRSWVSLKQRWSSVLKWRDGQERKKAQERKPCFGLGVRTRGQRKGK